MVLVFKIVIDNGEDDDEDDGEDDGEDNGEDDDGSQRISRASAWLTPKKGFWNDRLSLAGNFVKLSMYKNKVKSYCQFWCGQ